mgnify:FL=1
MNAGLKEYENVKNSFNNGKDGLKWLETTIKDFQMKSWEIRSNIQETKMAVILGKKWFDEFQSRDETELELDDVKYTFDLSEEVVEI